MKNFLIGLSKFVLGIFFALVIISVAGLAAARYFLTRLSDLPERPVFDDSPAKTVSAETTTSPSPTAADADANSEAQAESAEKPAEEAEEKEEEPLPEGAYRAAVTYSTGLIMRSGPGVEYQQTGGVDYNDELIVLQESNGWLKVRTSDGTEAWVKGRGNTKRVE